MRSVKELLGIASTARMLENVQHAAINFLRSRNIEQFDLHVILHAGRPTALIFADAQRRLRYSNILEEMLRRYVCEQCPDHPEAEMLVVFWRYRLSTETRQIAGPIAELEDFSAPEGALPFDGAGAEAPPFADGPAAHDDAEFEALYRRASSGSD